MKGNIYGMKEDTECSAGGNVCLHPKGWKANNGFDTTAVGLNWVPYSLMKAESTNANGNAWVLIYNPTTFDPQGGGIELRRIWRAKANSDNGVNGDVTAPISLKAVVESSSVPPPSSIVEGNVADSSGNGLSDMKLKIGGIGTESDSSGNFSFYNLPEGDYTLEPNEEDKAKYDFDPPKRNIHINGNGDRHTGQNFKAKQKQ